MVNILEGYPSPIIAGSVHIQYRKCGRQNCHCRNDIGHASYYFFYRESGRLRKKYLRATDVDLYRAACETRRRRKRMERAIVRQARTAWRNLTSVGRKMEQS